jgi:hypothetical protein
MAITPAILSMLYSGSAQSGSVDFSFLTRGTTSSGTAVADAGSIKTGLVNAEKNEAKQLAQVAKDPQVVKDLERYAKVVKNAKSIDEVLADPIARKVLMTANGLKGDVDNIGLLKKALLSDPDNAKSVANQLSSINAAWRAFAQKYDLATYGVDRLSPRMDGMAGRWRVTLEREGEPLEAMLEIQKARGGGLTAQIDGVPVPVIVEGDTVTIDLLWRDAEDELHTTRLTGTLGKDGLSGEQRDDGVKLDAAWGATPYFKDALTEVSENYIAEKRLDMLDQQLPGLGSAVLFKQIAASLKDATDILGSPLGREVITTAFNIPKQIAVQSLPAQEKAINQRMNPAKLANPAFADIVAQRYLMMLNGGLGGITA